MKRIIVGISGATGSIYGIRLLEVLSKAEVETHLVLTESAKKNILIETNFTVEQVESYASVVHDCSNVGASLASGSFHTDGMVIAPCSMKSLSALANSYNTNLLLRAADVVLKEKRKLVVMVRETPLHQGHLMLMLRLSQTGAIILPPMPAFYNYPETIDDIINQTVGKVLDLFGIENNLFKRWGPNSYLGKH
jgi:4-hydroxy-3-polyprenylbenzoate decarboxylase